jgi:branched-subunit amino acid transport protein
MTWTTVLLGAAGCFGLKLIGASLPASFLESELVKRIVLLLPIALLSALVAVQTLARQQELAIRLPALAVAMAALHWRRSFIEVVVVAALTAAVLRQIGWLP